MVKRTKKKSKNKLNPEFHCDVPDCTRSIHVGWKASGVSKRICEYHFARHNNNSDEFSLFDVFNLPRLKLGIDVDRFGIPLPKDYKEMMERASKQDKEEKDDKTEKSLERLKQWKENNGDRPKRKKTKSVKRPTTSDVQKEVDDIVGDILGD